VNPTTYRVTCGSRWGISAHAENDEHPCGTCLEADDIARARWEARQHVPERRPVDTTLYELIRVLDRLLTEADCARDRKRRAA
jgi:hypothetical protein